MILVRQGREYFNQLHGHQQVEFTKLTKNHDRWLIPEVPVWSDHDDASEAIGKARNGIEGEVEDEEKEEQGGLLCL